MDDYDAKPRYECVASTGNFMGKSIYWKLHGHKGVQEGPSTSDVKNEIVAIKVGIHEVQAQRWHIASQGHHAARTDISVEPAATLKAMACHALSTNKGSSFDRTFPDYMLTLVFHWVKTGAQRLE